MQDLRRLIKRIFSVLILVLLPLLGLADVSCCTWNMKWFPSGKGNRRASALEEVTKSGEAGNMILNSLKGLGDGALKDGVIIFLQEVRDAEVCSNLVSDIMIKDLKVASVSDFRDAFGVPLWQQTAILTTLPVMSSGFEEWKPVSGVKPPRGFAYALLDAGRKGVILCFSVHLKSNLNRNGTEFEEQSNIYKRECCAAQILERVGLHQNGDDSFVKVIVAGDFNTNEDDITFISEATLRSLYSAHFMSCFSGLRKNERVTCPGRGRYPDATFDYILYKGFKRSKVRSICEGAPISDHNIVSINLTPENIN